MFEAIIIQCWLANITITMQSNCSILALVEIYPVRPRLLDSKDDRGPDLCISVRDDSVNEAYSNYTNRG